MRLILLLISDTMSDHLEVGPPLSNCQSFRIDNDFKVVEGTQGPYHDVPVRSLILPDYPRLYLRVIEIVREMRISHN